MRVDDIAPTTGYGEPVQSRFNFSDGERIVGASSSDPKVHPVPEEPLEEMDPDGAKPPYAVVLTQGGKAVRFSVSTHFEPSTKNGRRYIGLPGGDEALGVFYSFGNEHVALATERGRAMLFSVLEIPPKSSAVRGVNAIKLDRDDKILGFTLTQKKRQGLTVWTSRGRELVVRETSYKPAKRAGRGAIVIRVGSLTRCDWPLVVLAPEAEEEPEGETEMDGEA
jgi:DNA gyrase subunit A